MAVLREQKRVETFQAQSHRETEASPIKVSTLRLSVLGYISDNTACMYLQCGVCDSGCGTRHAQDLTEKCLCLEGALTTC